MGSRPVGLSNRSPDIISACFNRLKGDNRTAQGFSPQKDYQKNRPEAAPTDSVGLVEKVAYTIRCERDCAIKYNNNISLRCSSIPIRTPFQGDSFLGAPSQG